MKARLNENEKIGALRGILENLVKRKHPYAEKMAAVGIRPEHIQSREDLKLLPYMTKTDLQANYPLGWLACDRKDLVRFHATSGTTGNPTVVAYTASDIQSWSDAVSWCLGLAGLDHHDTLHVAYGYGLFTGGLGLHYGAEQKGVSVVPVSGGFTERQVKLMHDLEATALACTPSYALLLAEAMEKSENPPTKLKVGIFGAEAWSEGLRRDLEGKLGIKALDIYGLSEAMGPGVAMECLQQNGLHVADSFIPEIIDPETLEVKPDGTHGELVLTSWNKQAFPVIRYRTRDLTRILPGACACGEQEARIERIQGRSDDMLIIHGVNVFPSMVEAALCKIPGLTPNYLIEVWKHEGMQEMSICCERNASSADLETIQAIGAKKMREALGVNVPLHIMEPNSLPRSEGKAKRVSQLQDKNQSVSHRK